MGSDFARIAATVRGNADLVHGFRDAFGAQPAADDEAVAVDVAKALAAFQER
jgi:cytochrome c peroxidase